MTEKESSAAERLVDELREQIIDGLLPPGTALRESNMVDELGTSRNTLREAFRILSYEGLLTHELHHGVSVRRLTAADVHDIFAARLALEPPALLRGPRPPSGAWRAAGDELRTLVDAASSAAAGDRWSDVARYNLRFHQVIVRLAGSNRLNTIFQHLSAELRLAFAEMANPAELHAPYIPWNGRIADLYRDGDPAACAAELERYLRHAEEALTKAMANRAA